MKKLPIVQIISGILIIASFFLYLSVIQDGYNEMEILDVDGAIIGYMEVSPMMPASYGIMKMLWMAGYPILGLLITGCGVARLVQSVRNSAGKGLDIAQIVFGTLVLALMVLFILRLEPSWQSYPTIDEITFPGADSIRFNPGWLVLMMVWRIVCLLLGTAVTISGIWQLEKSRSIKQ